MIKLDYSRIICPTGGAREIRDEWSVSWTDQHSAGSLKMRLDEQIHDRGMVSVETRHSYLEKVYRRSGCPHERRTAPGETRHLHCEEYEQRNQELEDERINSLPYAEA